MQNLTQIEEVSNDSMDAEAEEDLLSEEEEDASDYYSDAEEEEYALDEERECQIAAARELRREASRWDKVKRASGCKSPQTQDSPDQGKPPPPDSPLASPRRPSGLFDLPKGYRSWRANKQKIIDALEQSGGNVAFTRRYMLFKNGVNVPKNVIHYYNSRYCRPGCGEGLLGRSPASQKKQD